MPSPAEVVQWSSRLYVEVVRLPVTLAKARRLLVDLPDLLERLIVTLQGPLDGFEEALPNLADRVEMLAAELAATRESLDAILPELSRLVGGMDVRLENIDTEVAKALGGLDARLGHLDDVVSELGGTLTGVLGSIPGVGRAVAPAPPADRDRQPVPPVRLSAHGVRRASGNSKQGGTTAQQKTAGRKGGKAAASKR